MIRDYPFLPLFSQQKKTILIFASKIDGQGSGHWERMRLFFWFLKMNPCYFHHRLELIAVSQKITHFHKKADLLILDVRDQDPQVFAQKCPVLAIDNIFAERFSLHGITKKVKYPLHFYNVLQHASQIRRKKNLLIHPLLFFFRCFRDILEMTLLTKFFCRDMVIYGGSLRPSATSGRKIFNLSRYLLENSQVNRVRIIGDFSPFASYPNNFFHFNSPAEVLKLGVKLQYSPRLSSFRYFLAMLKSQYFITYFGQSLFESRYLLNHRVFLLPVISSIHQKLAKKVAKHYGFQSVLSLKVTQASTNQPCKSRTIDDRQLSRWQFLTGYQRLLAAMQDLW